MSRRGRRVAGRLLIVGAAAAGMAWVWAHQPPPLRYPAVTAAILDHVDHDGDGRLGPEEWALLAAEDDALSTYDLDHDGTLSATEVETLFLQAPPPRPLPR